MAALGALVAIVIELSEEREFARMVERAAPTWMLIAIALQVLTYVAQGAIWQLVARRSGTGLSFASAFGLSLTKLFVDQSLPTGGLSGAAVVVGAFERRGLGRPVAIATMIVTTIGYYVAYAVALGAALVIATARGHTSAVVVVPAALFGAFAVGVIILLVVFGGRNSVPPVAPARIPFLRKGLDVLRGADRRVVRERGNLLAATLLQLAIILLDAATVWTLIRALGADASPVGAYVSFLVSSLFRTISITPAGLGAFEAVSVVTLESTGIPLAVALSATMLFRGLSFWLPMLPGLVIARAIRRGRKQSGPQPPFHDLDDREVRADDHDQEHEVPAR